MEIVTIAPTIQIKGHFIPKLAIVIWNTGNHLHQLSPVFAPIMQNLKLVTDQASPAIFLLGAYQFRASNFKWDTFIGPGLRDKATGRDDLAGVRVFNNSKIAHSKSGALSADEIQGPFLNTLPIPFILPMDVFIEFSQSICIF